MKKELKIGNIILENNVLLAPMAGITDITFRTICKGFGAGLVYTEMVSAKGLYYRDVKTEQLMKTNKENRPVGLQLFGSDPEIMSYVVENYINDREDIDLIDINMGCPAPKIVKSGDGCSLMKNPELAGKIVSKIKKISKKPVTAKIRSGWDSNNINACEFAKVLEYNGADLITVHGRTREQFYTGKADYNIIKEVKKNLKIPVVGNGDIFTPSDGVKMIKETNCDGIMIGRGILGNPWLISNILRTLSNEYNTDINCINDIYEVTPKDKIEMLKRHVTMLSSELDEKIAIMEMRKHAGWYIKGMKNSSEIRNRINKMINADELFELLDTYLKNYEKDS